MHIRDGIVTVSSSAGESTSLNKAMQHLSSKSALIASEVNALKLKTSARLMEAPIYAQAEVDVAFSTNVSVL